MIYNLGVLMHLLILMLSINLIESILCLRTNEMEIDHFFLTIGGDMK